MNNVNTIFGDYFMDSIRMITFILEVVLVVKLVQLFYLVIIIKKLRIEIENKKNKDEIIKTNRNKKNKNKDKDKRIKYEDKYEK